jgi:hypothetical protein
MVAIAFNRVIGPVPIDCVITETHTSELDITEIPIENGARITDHAFVLPKKITLDIATGNAAASYNALVAFQESRLPFVLVSGLFVYSNMLVKALKADRDKTFSQILRCTADLQEIIIVSTAYAADPTGTSTGDPTNTSSSKLNSTNAGDPATADRVTGTTLRGDTGVTTTNTTGGDESILHGITQ